MTTKEKRLAIYFLKLAADSYGNHSCNDLDREAIGAANFTPQESRQFGIDYEKWNSDGAEPAFDFERLPDYAVMGFLAELLSREIAEEK